MSVRFLKSAVWPEDYPKPLLSEVAFLGRSNSGKSSLINAVLRHKVAKVSGQPGKTRLINFFEVNGKYRLVDLPGYGFAKVSQSEREAWRQMVETYMSIRGVLAGLVLVMDIRRHWHDEEAQLVAWVESLGQRGLVALNKADRVNTSERVGSERAVKGSVDWPVIVCSSLKKTGVPEIENQIWHWVKGGK